VSHSEYNIITPQVGAVRGNGVVITPTATTPDTPESTNQSGRTTKKVTVTVSGAAAK
jgi:hypothetical protein